MDTDVGENPALLGVVPRTIIMVPFWRCNNLSFCHCWPQMAGAACAKCRQCHSADLGRVNAVSLGLASGRHAGCPPHSFFHYIHNHLAQIVTSAL